MVRLKALQRIIAQQYDKNISIPYGAIKRTIQKERGSTDKQYFNSLWCD